MISPLKKADVNRIAFIDLEASGLGSAGFPTEIGWAVINENGSIECGSCLIKPPSKWTMYANSWSPVSERLTGISKEHLYQEGLPPRDAMNRLLAAIGDREWFSDAPDYDRHWLAMLTEAAGTDLTDHHIEDVKNLFGSIGVSFEAIVVSDHPQHRAGPDARRLALLYVGASHNERRLLRSGEDEQPPERIRDQEQHDTAGYRDVRRGVPIQ